MIAYCRAGNLSGLLNDQKIPEGLRPHMECLRQIVEGHTKKERRLSSSRLEPIGEDVLNMLKNRLNADKSQGVKWVTPEEWCLHSANSVVKAAPVLGRAFFHKRIEHMNVTFSTFTDNPNNSFIMFKQNNDEVLFGRIFSIFLHRRSFNPINQSETTIETWLKVQCFPTLTSNQYNPFFLIQEPNVQVHLRAWSPTHDVLIKVDDILCHCSWCMYKPAEVHPKILIPTVSLLCMAR